MRKSSDGADSAKGARYKEFWPTWPSDEVRGHLDFARRTRVGQRQAIAASANAIDEQLADHPAERGESREVGTRILLVPPLGVDFEVLEQDRQVFVLSVWRFPTD